MKRKPDDIICDLILPPDTNKIFEIKTNKNLGSLVVTNEPTSEVRLYADWQLSPELLSNNRTISVLYSGHLIGLADTHYTPLSEFNTENIIDISMYFLRLYAEKRRVHMPVFTAMLKRVDWEYL